MIDHNKINKVFIKILATVPRTQEDLHLSEEQIHQQKEKDKITLIDTMSENVEILLKTKQISPDQAKYAQTALDFYRNNVMVLPFKSMAQTLNELAFIDYSKAVDIITIKSDRLLTQMQRPDEENTYGGNFFSVGSIPAEYEHRAAILGIGIITTTDNFPEDYKKSIYIVKTNKSSTFLRSTAAASVDTWSKPGFSQPAKGGGLQLRIATKDYVNVQKLPYLNEVKYGQNGTIEKPLLKGYSTSPNKPNKTSKTIRER